MRFYTKSVDGKLTKYRLARKYYIRFKNGPSVENCKKYVFIAEFDRRLLPKKFFSHLKAIQSNNVSTNTVENYLETLKCNKPVILENLFSSKRS
jgi:hypothetical protein